ncbi:MAG: Lrp/AsnC ligand binding domain-containing protein [Actinomycetota bacterium]
MAVSAYVLIQIEMGKAGEVAGRIRDIDGVVTADIATGPYDIIAKTSAETMDDLGRMVVGQIEMVDGITRTLTCPVINL